MKVVWALYIPHTTFIYAHSNGCAILFCTWPESEEAPWWSLRTSKATWRLTTKSTWSPMSFPSAVRYYEEEKEIPDG